MLQTKPPELLAAAAVAACSATCAGACAQRCNGNIKQLKSLLAEGLGTQQRSSLARECNGFS